MINFYIKKISIDKAVVGMVIAADVITNTGINLMSKNTVLNKKNITKLKLYSIEYIEIYKEQKSDIDFQHLFMSNDTKPKTQYKDIKVINEFRSNHQNKQDVLKNKMMDISEGKKIEIPELYSISNELIEKMNDKSQLFSFLNNLQYFDDYTYSHSVNVSLVSYTLGQWLGYSGEELQCISVAGLLHDIGKTKVSIDLLNKKEKLTTEEFNEIKKHCVYGFRIIEKQNIPYNVKMAVLMHHEKIDGSGYPMGLKGDEINDYAKIIAIADIYDAMTSERPYRKKYCPFSVIEFFEKNYITKLDTKFLMTFLNNIAHCYLDSWVELSTGEEAKIKFINTKKPSKPIVQIDNVLADLSKEKDIFIVRVI